MMPTASTVQPRTDQLKHLLGEDNAPTCMRVLEAVCGGSSWDRSCVLGSRGNSTESCIQLGNSYLSGLLFFLSRIMSSALSKCSYGSRSLLVVERWAVGGNFSVACSTQWLVFGVCRVSWNAMCMRSANERTERPRY